MPPANDGSTAVNFRSWYLEAATDGQRIIATFHPEAWQNDDAISVDPGATDFDVTAEVLSLGRKAALALLDNDYPSDNLRESVAAPEWVKDWAGPFRISCSEVIQAYYADDQAAAAS